MAIEFVCANGECGTKLNVPDDLAGEEAQCPQCGQTTRAPVPAVQAESTMLGDYELGGGGPRPSDVREEAGRPAPGL